MARVHLKDTPGRDTSQSRLAQGTTTKVYPLRYSEEEQHSDRRNWQYSEGLRIFSRTALLLLVNVALWLHFPRRALRYEKISRNAAREYL